VKVQLVNIDQFPGDKVHYYSLIVDNDENNLFDKFLLENIETNRSEIMDILIRLQLMGEEYGARENFFKLNEGKPGDGVVALYDQPRKNLRLYCIRFGASAVILGGGGLKRKDIRAYQEDPLLKRRAECMIKVSKLIREYMKNKEFILNEDGTITCNVIMQDYE
jgi:hypothetical protein